MFRQRRRLWYKKYDMRFRVIGYVRVSTEIQKEKDNSVRSQIKCIKKYCEDYEYELVRSFNSTTIIVFIQNFDLSYNDGIGEYFAQFCIKYFDTYEFKKDP